MIYSERDITMQKKTSGKRGFSLIEASIVLGVVGLVIGGVWVASASYRTTQKVAAAQDDIFQVVQNVRSLYASGHIANEGEEVMGLFINMGVFPPGMVSGSGAVSRWGGTVEVSVADDQFDIAFTQIPKAACIKLTMALAADTEGNGLSRTTINANDFTDGISLAQADASCNASTFLTWTYGLNGEKLAALELEAPISLPPEEM